MPRPLFYFLALLVPIGLSVPAAVAGGSSAVLNVTARVVAACSVAAHARDGQGPAGVGVAHRCSMDVPHRVSVGDLPPPVARGRPPLDSVPPQVGSLPPAATAAARPPEGRPTVAREPGRAGETVIVTVTY